jgi:hypothetical protein
VQDSQEKYIAKPMYAESSIHQVLQSIFGFDKLMGSHVNEAHDLPWASEN